MKEEGAKLVAQDAITFLVSTIEKEAIRITKKAVKSVKNDRRKRLMSSDISEALE